MGITRPLRELWEAGALSSGLANGQRKFVSDLDVAFLRDIGWTVMPANLIPEPASLTLLAVGAVVLLGRRGRRR